MPTLDPYRITNELDETILDVVVTRLEARGKHPLFDGMLRDYLDAMDIDKVISLDMITSGEDMVFKKAAYTEVELSSVEPCDRAATSRASAQAIVDPIFRFDQERFDREQGARSFPLEDYFTILVSPNLNKLLARDGFEGN